MLFAACYQPLEQFVSRNSRCTISKCFQETLGITATEEDGLLHGLSVRINPSGCRFMQDTICHLFFAVTNAIGAANSVSIIQTFNNKSAVALFHETERNLTKPSNYCRQMCYKNASNSNKSIPLSMVMRMDIVGNI